ncbi:MAG: hypothetical protein HY741_16820 [Chloroflexi bacterium]|nr:hypothetical protein [Chloroflexota bacterium]
MDLFLSLLCFGAFFVPTFIGVGVTLLVEKYLGVWAYLVGWALPVILLIGLYAVYDVYLRATPCEPAASLACGEPLAYAFVLFIALLCLTVFANALAQGAVYFFLRARRQPVAATPQ